MIRTRTLALVAIGATATVVAGLGVAAVAAAPAGRTGTGSAQQTARQTAEWPLHADHVSSRRWHYLDLTAPPTALAGFSVRSTGLVTLTVSAKITGAPMQLRWLDNGTVEKPASVSYAPSAHDDAFSYTFADRGRAEPCGHTLRLQWRSVTGGRVSVHSGDVVATYSPAADSGTVCA